MLILVISHNYSLLLLLLQLLLLRLSLVARRIARVATVHKFGASCIYCSIIFRQLRLLVTLRVLLASVKVVVSEAMAEHGDGVVLLLADLLALVALKMRAGVFLRRDYLVLLMLGLLGRIHDHGGFGVC